MVARMGAMMGVDIYGLNPITNEGDYFRMTWWFWRPIAEYCRKIAPEIAAKCKHWDTNDGDGLNHQDSVALADALQREIDSGRCAKYALIRASSLEVLRNETCEICEGTGVRKPYPEHGAGDLTTGIKCNGCKGDGYVRPWASHYNLTVESAQRFASFLRNCGGFEIC